MVTRKAPRRKAVEKPKQLSIKVILETKFTVQSGTTLSDIMSAVESAMETLRGYGDITRSEMVFPEGVTTFSID